MSFPEQLVNVALDVDNTEVMFLLFIYCHLYSTFSFVQCSNALYRLLEGDIQWHTGQPSARDIDTRIVYNQ